MQTLEHLSRSVIHHIILTQPQRIGYMEWKSVSFAFTGKNNGFPFLDILGYLKSTHKTREFPTEFPDWDLSHSSKFEIFVGIL